MVNCSTTERRTPQADVAALLVCTALQRRPLNPSARPGDTPSDVRHVPRIRHALSQ